MEPRNQRHRGAHTVHNVEGHTVGGAMRESSAGPARSENQGMYGIFMREIRESPAPARRCDQPAGRSGNASGGTPEMYGSGQSDSPVVPANLPNMANAAEVGGGKTSHVVCLSSGNLKIFLMMCPCGVFVISCTGFEAAVQDAD